MSNIIDKLLPAKVNQIATRLPRDCSGPACSQPACRPTRHRCKTVGLHAGSFRKMSLFGNDDSFRHETSTCFAHGRYTSVCKISPSLRHGVSEEIGPRQNKQTLKYLVDG